MTESALRTIPEELESEFVYPYIVFGNTGFNIYRREGMWEWHFTPEGHNKPNEVSEENRSRYIRMFVVGFGEFLRWLKIVDFKEFNVPEIDDLESVTNEGMKDFLLSIFGKNSLEVRKRGAKFVVKIKVKEILKNDEILKIIKDFEKSALNRPIKVYE